MNWCYIEEDAFVGTNKDIKLVCRPECLELHRLTTIASSSFGPLA
jgi:hypothetical protein